VPASLVVAPIQPELTLTPTPSCNAALTVTPTASQDGLIVPGTWAGSNTVADAAMISCPSTATAVTLADAATQTVALAGLQSALNKAVYSDKTGASTVSTISAVAEGLLTVTDSSFGATILTYRVQEVNRQHAASPAPLKRLPAAVPTNSSRELPNQQPLVPFPAAGLSLPARGHRRCLQRRCCRLRHLRCRHLCHRWRCHHVRPLPRRLHRHRR
jgi:hypothetical protein